MDYLMGALHWIWNNREWTLSGLVLAVATGLIKFFLPRRIASRSITEVHKNQGSENQSISSSSNVVQAGRDINISVGDQGETASIPQSQVLIFGQDNSYWFEDFRYAKKKPVIEIKTIRGPRELKDQDIPVKSFKWRHPAGVKLFTIVAENKGRDPDKNIKIDISFGDGAIGAVTLESDDRMKVIGGGGMNASYVSFLIPELLPKERHSAEVLVKGGKVAEATAWSEYSTAIDDVFVFDLIFSLK